MVQEKNVRTPGNLCLSNHHMKPTISLPCRLNLMFHLFGLIRHNWSSHKYRRMYNGVLIIEVLISDNARSFALIRRSVYKDGKHLSFQQVKTKQFEHPFIVDCNIGQKSLARQDSGFERGVKEAIYCMSNWGDH